MFTPTSLEGVFQPLSLNGPCQDQVTLSLSLFILLGRSVLPISGCAFSFLSTPSPWPGAHTHVDQSQSPVELGAPGGQRPPLSIRGSMPVLPWWAPWRMSNSLSMLFMDLGCDSPSSSCRPFVISPACASPLPMSHTCRRLALQTHTGDHC